jgi:gliding motility-associated-like protein
MLKYLSICLFLVIFSPIKSQIIAVRNVCVGSIVEIKTTDFTCAVLSTLPGIEGNTAYFPLYKFSLANRSITIQVNKASTQFFFVACANNVTQRIQINFVDCDTAQCLGPNLVPNPSFETIQECINPRISLTGVAANWLDYPITQADNKGSVDFYHKLCAGGGFAGILTDNPPRTGQGMVGAFVFRQVDNGGGVFKNNFEYPVVPLNQALMVGQKYRVRFHVKYPNGYSAADKISAGFVVGDPNAVFQTTTAPNGTVGYDYIGDPAKVSNPVGQYISESVFWTKIEGIFTADKPYTHLILGNLGGLTTSLAKVSSYYLFDDVSVQAVDESILRQLTRADTLVCKGQTATIGIKTSANKTSLRNLTTAQTTLVDTSKLINIPNVNATTCYQFVFEKNNCKDSLNFCVKNYPSYDTIIKRFSCLPRDTGLIVSQLRTFRGCDSIVTLRTDLKLLDTMRGADIRVCNQADTGLAVLTLKNNEGCDSVVLVTKKWSKPDTTRFEKLSCFAKDTGSIVKKNINRFGCDSFVFLKTTWIPPIELDLGRDTVADVGSRFNLVPILRGDTAKAFLWQPPLGLSCTNCPNPEVILPKSVRYSLTVTNRGGCTSRAERLVQSLDKPFIYVPTAFSPNGDGTNETLTVYANTNRVELIKKLTIFDRWGNLLFTNKDFLPNDEKAGWDGLFKGKKVSQDVYVYVVEFMLFDKQIKTVSGDVTVVF